MGTPGVREDRSQLGQLLRGEQAAFLGAGESCLVGRVAVEVSASLFLLGWGI